MGDLYLQLLIAYHEVKLHRWFALCVAAAICLVGWIGIGFVPNRYESEARIFVQLQTLLPDNIGMSIAARQKAVDRVKRTLTSTVNIERVIRSTDLVNILPNDADVTAEAEALRKKISVVEQHENLFQITATIGYRQFNDVQNARLARLVVQKMIDIFVEDNLSGDRKETSESIAFLDKQIEDARAKMDEAEAARSEFDRAAYGGLPGSGSPQQRLAEARQELNNLDFEILSAQSALAQGEGQGLAESGAGGPTDPATALKAQIAEALSRGWTENHPDIIAMRRQLARLPYNRGSNDAASRPRSRPSALAPLMAERRLRLSQLIQRKMDLQRQISLSSAQIEARPDVSAEQDRLNRNFETVRDQYASLLTKRENLKLQDQVISSTDTVSFRVIDPPSSPREPALPSRPILFAMVGVFAAAAGIGAAFLYSLTVRSFPTAQRLVTATGLPVIGMIPEAASGRSGHSQTQQNWIFRAAVGALFSILTLLIVIDEVQRSILA